MCRRWRASGSAPIRETLRALMWDHVGILRHAAGLAQARAVLSARLAAQPVAGLEASETANLALVGWVMAEAALRREESRGAHQRTDFPARDDVRFLSHSLVYRNSDGSPRVEYLPVTITRWPPAERVYGEAAAHAGPHHTTDSALST